MKFIQRMMRFIAVLVCIVLLGYTFALSCRISG